ncbi:hypothetical protein AGMMS50229_19440 [Campylobacterota bacterium]|nr:hypothetical protein AGMMS50229_19440 [Campylobacterota bacterium]
MWKFIIVPLLVLLFLYLLFAPRKKPKQDGYIEELVKCEKCGIYCAPREAVIKDGRFFCSKQCAGVKDGSNRH